MNTEEKNEQKQERPCSVFHSVGGKMPQDNDYHLNGQKCDCGRIMFYIEPCGCASRPGFLRSKPNPDFVDMK